jgi:hypothetical protein
MKKLNFSKVFLSSLSAVMIAGVGASFSLLTSCSNKNQDPVPPPPPIPTPTSMTLVYSQESYVFTLNQPSGISAPALTDDLSQTVSFATYSISPALQSSFVLNSYTGLISASLATSLLTQTSYTVTALGEDE